jgi:hypothetical protein
MAVSALHASFAQRKLAFLIAFTALSLAVAHAPKPPISFRVAPVPVQLLSD